MRSITTERINTVALDLKRSKELAAKTNKLKRLYADLIFVVTFSVLFGFVAGHIRNE